MIWRRSSSGSASMMDERDGMRKNEKGCWVGARCDAMSSSPSTAGWLAGTATGRPRAVTSLPVVRPARGSGSEAQLLSPPQPPLIPAVTNFIHVTLVVFVSSADLLLHQPLHLVICTTSWSWIRAARQLSLLCVHPHTSPAATMSLKQPRIRA